MNVNFQNKGQKGSHVQQWIHMDYIWHLCKGNIKIKTSLELLGKCHTPHGMTSGLKSILKLWKVLWLTREEREWLKTIVILDHLMNAAQSVFNFLCKWHTAALSSQQLSIISTSRKTWRKYRLSIALCHDIHTWLFQFNIH